MRKISRNFWKKYGLPEQSKLKGIVTELWKQPRREHQYFSMELAEKIGKQAPEKQIGLYGYMATHKSWWGTVDFVAPKLMGHISNGLHNLLSRIPTSGWNRAICGCNAAPCFFS